MRARLKGAYASIVSLTLTTMKLNEPSFNKKSSVSLYNISLSSLDVS